MAQRFGDSGQREDATREDTGNSDAARKRRQTRDGKHRFSVTREDAIQRTDLGLRKGLGLHGTPEPVTEDVPVEEHTDGDGDADAARLRRQKRDEAHKFGITK